jgi:hypothetical protein
MSIYEHLTEFAGLPVVEWEPDTGAAITSDTAYRLSISYEEAEEGQQWNDKLAALMDDPGAGQVAGLVVGPWGMMSDQHTGVILEPLVAARDRLPALRTLFLCDVISEECEISWIHQSDLSPLFAAYPGLEHFGVRGTENLSLGTLRHPRLKTLVIQSGGLPASVVREVAAADLPELEHLELWLGEENYGGDATVADLAPILAGSRFPKLRYLGLRDAEQANEVAAAVATAPVMQQIRVLDLSLGTLDDQGAMALLASPAVGRLEKLDIHHHFCSAAMVEKLLGLGIEVDASDVQEPTEYRERYVAVGE